MAKKEQRKQNVFPDGTPISEWFLQTKVVHPDSLGKNTTFPIMELKAIPISFKHKNTKDHRRSGSQWRWGHLHP